MQIVFTILSLISLLGLIIGLISPKVVIRWGEKKTRGQVFKIFGILFIVFVCIIGATTPSQEKKTEILDKTAVSTPLTPDSKESETKAPVAIEKTDDASAKTKKQQRWADWIFNVYTLIGWLLIVITGVVLGFKQRITVFRDYNDLGLIFLIALSPVVLFYLFSIIAGEQQRVWGWFIIIVETVLFLWIVIRTFKDNSNFLGALVALITKFSLSILFIFSFLSFVAPQGKTAAQRAKSRYNALAIMVIVAPLVFKLVKNKEGFFNPERTLASRGIGV